MNQHSPKIVYHKSSVLHHLSHSCDAALCKSKRNQRIKFLSTRENNLLARKAALKALKYIKKAPHKLNLLRMLQFCRIYKLTQTNLPFQVFHKI